MAMIPAALLVQQLSLLSLLVLHTSATNFDQIIFTYHKCNNNLGNFTIGDTYDSNRNALLTNIYSNKEIDYGFYNFSSGQDADKVNGIGLCRGDVGPDDCRSCLKSAGLLIILRCPNQKEAVGWYDECMIRYSNRSISGLMEIAPNSVMCSTENITTTSVRRFNKVLNELLGGLSRNVTGFGDSRRKVGEANATVLGLPSSRNSSTIHALLQCTPDLSRQSCGICLNQSFSLIHEFCDGKKGGRYIGPSCNARYETAYPFFGPLVGPPPPLPPPPPPPLVPRPSLPPLASAIATSTQAKSNTSRTVVAIVVPVVVLIILLVLIYIYVRVRRPRNGYAESFLSEAEVDNEIKTTELMQFDFETIRIATNNFSNANKLGQGGFGTVYKGGLSNGQEVAIKRLSHNSCQGQTEFKNEVLLTGKLQHRNLVRLLGFCLERRERLLIYEFVPNKSLDYIIFDPIKRANLDWEARYKIIKGIARGLLYLHEDSRLQIVHRDIKLSNILLDEELNPKISDFGMARLFDVNQTQGNTSTIAGTFGYMAPEYIKHGHYSVKSDVFSFGVMILEILCGKRKSEICNGEIGEDLLSIAWSNWRRGTFSSIIDPALNCGSNNEIMRCAHIGLLCVQEDIADRPTMTSVLSMLNSSSFPLPDPSEPPFLMRDKRLLSISSCEQHSEATRSNDSGTQSAQGTTYTSQLTDVYPR